jgi:RecA-family ATPase
MQLSCARTGYQILVLQKVIQFSPDDAIIAQAAQMWISTTDKILSGSQCAVVFVTIFQQCSEEGQLDQLIQKLKLAVAVGGMLIVHCSVQQVICQFCE